VDLSDLKGIGPATIKRLAARGIVDQRELLCFFPRAYRRIHRFFPGDEVVREQWEHIEAWGEIISVQRPGRYSRAPIKVLVDFGGARAQLLWFNMGNAKFTRSFVEGKWIRFEGDLDHTRRPPQMSHPNFRVAAAPTKRAKRVDLVPIYPSMEGIPDSKLRSAIEQAAANLLPAIQEVVPQRHLVAQELPSAAAALKTIHLLAGPPDLDEFDDALRAARARLVYEEFYTLQKKLALDYLEQRKTRKALRCTDATLFDTFCEGLPFELTGDQQSALDTLVDDMSTRVPMRRLLQGDVGSGKTVVAFAAAARAIGNGAQVAMMAPTDVLANQHLRRASEFFEGLPVRIDLLTGALGAAEKRAVLERLAQGKIDLIIGTHALFQDDVVFAGGRTASASLDLVDLASGRSDVEGLGLVIIDEQHKFGVEQREMLMAKGRDPHLLAMTATPIPRSLAHAFFGDLDLTVIKEKPPGRKPVRTILRDARAKPKLYAYVREQVESLGIQAYVVFPLVEASEKVPGRNNVVDGAEELANGPLSGLKVGVLHGRMTSDEKDAIMQRFGGGEVDVLCSTTVIEVGVDVPNATMMIIDGPENFGLSQLHQLRGRVGRGKAASMCVLLAGFGLTEEASERLRSFTATEDGFELAEIDLKMRGPGQFLGVRQAGMAEFRFGDLVRDAELLGRARADARRDLFGEAS
jgi:ATP-dependent DNA helicase RecG